MHIPTLIPLAKPTLPTIKDTAPFIAPISTEAAVKGVTESDTNVTIHGNNDIGQHKETSADSEPLTDKFSNEFLSEWIASNSANIDSAHISLGIVLVAASFLLAVLRK